MGISDFLWTLGPVHFQLSSRILFRIRFYYFISHNFILSYLYLLRSLFTYLTTSFFVSYTIYLFVYGTSLKIICLCLVHPFKIICLCLMRWRGFSLPPTPLLSLFFILATLLIRYMGSWNLSFVHFHNILSSFDLGNRCYLGIFLATVQLLHPLLEF